MVMTPIFKSPETPEPSEEILETKKLFEEEPKEKPEGNFPIVFDNTIMDHIWGTVDFVSDVVTAPSRLLQNEEDTEEDPNVLNKKIEEVNRGWTRELDENVYKKDYDRSIKAATKMGHTITVPKNGEQVLATFDNLTKAQQNEVLQKRKVKPATLAELTLDVAAMFGTGAVGYNMFPDINAFKKASVVAKSLFGDAYLEQVLLYSQEDKFSNLANVVRDYGETYPDENPLKSVLSNPITNYIAAEKDDSELELRAKTMAVSAIMTGMGETAFKFAGISLGAANTASKKMYGKTVNQLNKLQVNEFVNKLFPILRKDRVRHNNGSSLVLGLGLPNFSFLNKQSKKLSESEVQLIKQTTKADANILSRGASSLRRIKQRWFTSNGYAPRKAWESEQQMIRRTRALRTEADGIAKRLQRYLDEAIHEYDGDILKNITSALETNLSDVKPEIHLEVLQRKFDLPEEVAREVLNGRNMIDRLSQMVLDSNIGTEPVRAAIAENLGTYTRRSYRMFEEKGFIPSNSAKRKATEFFRNQYLAKKHKINLKEIDDDLNWEDLGLSADEIAEGSTWAEREVITFLKHGEEKNFDQFLGSVMRVNNSLLKERKDIPKELRELMGEIQNPPLNIVQTANNLIQLIESNKYYNEVLELGGSVPENKELYSQALDKARSMLRHIDLSIIPEDKLTKGEFVNVRSEKTNEFTVGKIIGKTQEGYKVEIKDFKTQRTTTQIVPVDRVKQSEEAIGTSYDLELIPRDNIVRKLADSMYLDEGASYTKPSYIFDQHQGDASIFNTQIDMPGNPLHGKWTTKEYSESLAGLEDYAFVSTTIKNSPLFHKWRYIKGVSQSLKTVWDWTTQLRNNLGGMQFALNNGMNPFKGGNGNFKILIEQMAGNAPEDFIRQYNKLQRLGVVNTSVMGGEGQALMKAADGATPQEWEGLLAKLINKAKDPVWKSKPPEFDSVKTKWYQYPQKMYMAIDDFYKMNAYATELDWLKKAKPDAPLELLEDEAAALVRNTFPNYDVIPKGFKSLRDLPFGNFVAFTPEIIRTQGNIVRQIIKELQTPGLRKRGVARLGGGLLVHGSWAGAGIGAKELLMWDDERLEAINVLTEAPWSDRHNKIPVEINGKLGVINPMYLNPYDVFHGVYQDIQTAFAKGEINNLDADTIAQEATFKAIHQMMSFATDNAMVADVAQDLLVAYNNDNGRRGDGKQIFKSKDPEDLVWNSLQYLADTVISPGFILDGKKLFYDLPTGKINKQTGDKLDWEFVVLEMLSGFNISAVNPEHSLVLASGRYKGIKAHRIQQAAMEEDRGDPKDWANNFMRRNAEKFMAARDAYRKINAVKNMGVGELKIEQILKEEANLNDSEMKEIYGGTFHPFTITKNTKKLYDEYYADHPDHEEVLDYMIKYVEDIRGMPLYSYQMDDIEKAKRLQDGKGTGFYKFGPPENYEELKKDYDFNLDFAEGGKVEGVSNVKADPKERRDPYSGQSYADTAEIKEKIEGFLILDNDRLNVVNGGEIKIGGKAGKLANLFHATLKEFKKLKNTSSDLGTHIGSSEQAANRLENKIVEDRMKDVKAERDLDLDFAEVRLKELKNSKADPKLIKGVENEIKLLERDIPLDDFLENARMLRVSVNKGKSLVTEDAGEWRELDTSIDALLHSDLVKKADGTKDINFIRRLNRQRKKAEDVKYKYDDPRDFYTSTEAKKIRNKIVKLIKEKGYDSIEYKNLVESPYAAEGDELKSYIIFDPENITIEEDELIKSEEQLRKPRAEGGYEKLPGKLGKISKLIGAFKKSDPMGFRNISEDIIEDPNFPSKGTAAQMRSAFTGGKGGRLPEEQVKKLGGIPKVPEEELEVIGLKDFLDRKEKDNLSVTKEELKDVIERNKMYTEFKETKLSDEIQLENKIAEVRKESSFNIDKQGDKEIITNKFMPELKAELDPKTDEISIYKEDDTGERIYYGAVRQSYLANDPIEYKLEAFGKPIDLPPGESPMNESQFVPTLKNNAETLRLISKEAEKNLRRMKTKHEGYIADTQAVGITEPNKFKIQSAHGPHVDPTHDPKSIDTNEFQGIEWPDPIDYNEYVVYYKNPVYKEFGAPMPVDKIQVSGSYNVPEISAKAGIHYSDEGQRDLIAYHLRTTDRQMIVDPENADVKKHQNKLDNFSIKAFKSSRSSAEFEANKMHFADFAKDYHGRSKHPSGKVEKIDFIQEVQSDLAQFPTKGNRLKKPYREEKLDPLTMKVDPTYGELTPTGKAMKHAGVTQADYRLAFQRWDTPKHSAIREEVANKFEKFRDATGELSAKYAKEMRALRTKVIADMKTTKDLIKLKDEVVDLYKNRINYLTWNIEEQLSDKQRILGTGSPSDVLPKHQALHEKYKKERDDLFKILDDALSDEFFDGLTAGDQKMMLINKINKFPLKPINKVIIPEEDLARYRHKQNLILQLRKNADVARRTLPEKKDLIPVTPLVKDNAWVRHAIKNVIGKMIKGNKDRAVFSSGEGQIELYAQVGDTEGIYDSYKDMLTDDKGAPSKLLRLKEFYNKTLVQEARKVLKQIDPDAVEVIKIKDKLILNSEKEDVITKHHLTIKNTPKLRAFVEGAEGTPEGFTTFGKRKGGIVRQGNFDGGRILRVIKTLPKFKKGGKVFRALANTRR